ncbi:hypothetical protein CEXT_11221 [Caerostris extrusa]|uniref:Uncharacterized protein n=1 Tax=Caerostris extrusa TaxID=172846 RepID=A0AAV4XIR7_CAEEX|nr:hypothetical protein CEXT_11221 [Caerostris extrusa]
MSENLFTGKSVQGKSETVEEFPYQNKRMQSADRREKGAAMIRPLITSPQTQRGWWEVIAQLPINLPDQLVLLRN